MTVTAATAWVIIEQAGRQADRQARVFVPLAGDWGGAPRTRSERGGMEGKIWRKETNTNECEVPE